MGRTTAGWRAPPAPASPGAAAERPAPAPARHSLGPAWRYLRPLAAARHCARPWWSSPLLVVRRARCPGCLLYTSDAADDLLCVDLGGRRIIKKKKNTT